MFKHFQDYYWKDGKPYGRKEVDPTIAPCSYKVIVDPYYKRFSVERYRFSRLEKVIYDSYLLDFRHLTLKGQTAWQRELVKEEESSSLGLLRNQEDRAILFEGLMFENDLCRQCTTTSIHGVPLATHKMYYRSLTDAFNGVILYDIEERPVMMKVYEVDDNGEEFTNLLLEIWDMQNYSTYQEVLDGNSHILQRGNLSTS